MDEGAARVFAAATHGLFSGARTRTSKPLRSSRSSSRTPSPAAGAPDKIQVLSCADLLTDSIRRIFTDDSVSEVFGGENQLF
jgi:ribose-phosphate pyrophosphokinase